MKIHPTFLIHFDSAGHLHADLALIRLLREHDKAWEISADDFVWTGSKEELDELVQKAEASK